MPGKDSQYPLDSLEAGAADSRSAGPNSEETGAGAVRPEGSGSRGSATALTRA